MSKRLEGGFLTARPTWSTAATPGVWAAEQHFARVYANGWPSASALFDPYFESVSLLLHMDGSNGSTTFVDSSLGNLTVTANGNAQISTAQSKFGGSSGAFDGTGDNLNIATPSSFLIDWAGGDFTLEYWIRCTAFPAASGSGSAPIIIGNMSNSADTNYWSFGPIGDGKVRFYYYNGGPVSFTTTSSLALNTWHHLAFVKSGTGMTIYIDGVSSATATVSGTPQFLSATGLSVGQYVNTSFNGYLDEIRLTKGIARYTANFAVPGIAGYDEGAVLYDPYFDYVSLLLRCNGANNSTTFTDSSNNATAITRGGGAVISTAASRFGEASVYFNGTNDSLSFPDPALGTSNFTIEMWFKTTSSVQYAQFIGNESTGYTFVINNTSATSGNIALYAPGGGLVCQTSGTSYRDDRWHHLALTRSGNNFTIWVDGASSATGTNSSSFSGQTNYVGRNNVYTPRNLIGYIDDLRITKGVARYTTAFRPVGPYGTTGKLVDPYLTSTSLLLPMTGDNGTTSFLDRSNNFLRATEYGNAKISTTQNKFGGTSAYFDGNGDYLTISSSNLDPGSNNFTIECWVYPTSIPAGLTTLWAHRSTTGVANGASLVSSGSSGALQFYVATSAGWVLSGTSTGHTLTANTWQHLAMVRNGSTITLYKDGTSGTPATFSGTVAVSGAFSVMAGSAAGGQEVPGYVDDFRFTNGVARYTSAFISPARAFNDELLDDPYFNNVSLLLHMDGANNSTTFTDSSLLNLPVTANADAKISIVQSKFGSSSGTFDGTGDYLSQATRTDLALGTSDFTIETWVYLNSYTQFSFWESSPIGSGGGRSTGFIWYMTTNGTMYLFHNTVNLITTSAAIFPLSTWAHVACCRSSGTTRLFVNGISVGSTSTTITDTAGGRVIGAFCDGGSYSPNGYLDEFRITKGIARYTSNFVPPTLPFYNPTAPTSDPNFSSVSLLLPMNGSNGSTTFTDSSSNALTVTANNGAAISTTQSKFGGASGFFDGSNDYLNIASNSLLNFGTGDWTVEFWMYYTDTANAYPCILGVTPSWSAGVVSITHDHAWASNKLSVTANSHSVGAPVVSSSTLSTATWYHCAVVRNGTTMRIFINGTQDGTATISSGLTFDFSNGATRIGGANGDGAASYYSGYLDDLRITKGVARYTSNFTPPIAALPTA